MKLCGGKRTGETMVKHLKHMQSCRPCKILKSQGNYFTANCLQSLEVELQTLNFSWLVHFIFRLDGIILLENIISTTR